MTALTLYHFESCPFCRRVRSAARRLGVELDLVDIYRTPGARAYLLANLGRKTVPVLRIQTGDSDELLPESAKIIAWLENYATTLDDRAPWTDSSLVAAA